MKIKRGGTTLATAAAATAIRTSVRRWGQGPPQRLIHDPRRGCDGKQQRKRDNNFNDVVLCKHLNVPPFS